MEGQTEIVATEAPAGAPGGGGIGGAPAAPPDVGSLSEGDYARQRSEFEKANGPGSWLKQVSSAPAAPAKPAADAKPAANGKPNGAAPADEMIDGEISIDESGTARDKRTGQFVPKSAFLRIKGEAHEHKQTNESLKAEVIRARERLSIFEEATKPKEEPKAEAKPIDPKEDIFGAYDYVASQVKALKEQLDGNTKTTEKAIADQRNKDAVTSDMRQFSSREPAFVEAFTFLKDQHDAELQAIGIDDKDKRDAQIRNDLRDFVTEALANKRSPAELLFKRAQARGFQIKAPAQTGETAAQKAAREDIERINAGRDASASLRGAGGGGNVGEQLTRDKVATMPEGEYYTARTAYIAKHGRAAWEKMISV